jgi:hypothetical protein
MEVLLGIFCHERRKKDERKEDGATYSKLTSLQLFQKTNEATAEVNKIFCL